MNLLVKGRINSLRMFEFELSAKPGRMSTDDDVPIPPDGQVSVRVSHLIVLSLWCVSELRRMLHSQTIFAAVTCNDSKS